METKREGRKGRTPRSKQGHPADATSVVMNNRNWDGLDGRVEPPTVK